MNILVGPYYVRREGKRNWAVYRAGGNAELIDTFVTAAEARAEAKRLNKWLVDSHKTIFK